MSISNQELTFSVSEISSSIKNLIEDNFAQVAIKGEISGFVHHQSGHMYMTLKDENSSIKATCWKFTIPKLDIMPEEGMEVIATGKITTYDKNSSYQLNISNIKPSGIGALLKQLEERKKKLSAEGLFDEEHKKPIPRMPNTIGVITSPTGAVIHDIMHRIKERFPTNILLYPVKVQGSGTSQSVVEAIKFFNNPPAGITKPDVIIVARGGGSIEDLWEFNSEEIARATFASELPIISAVGHETDTTLIDYVSDRRAPTPTGAAEMAVPVKTDIQNYLSDRESRLNNAMRSKVSQEKLNLSELDKRTPDLKTVIVNKKQILNELNLTKNHSVQNILNKNKNNVELLGKSLTPPKNIIQNHKKNIENMTGNIKIMLNQILKNNKVKVDGTSALLESYSFKKTLQRGFTIITDENKNLIKDSSQLANEQNVQIQFSDDTVNAKIKK